MNEERLAEVQQAHPECVAICLAGALYTRLDSLEEAGPSESAPLGGIPMQQKSCKPSSLETMGGLLGVVRSLTIEALDLTSTQQLIAFVLLERILEHPEAGGLAPETLRPLLIGASWLALKLSADEDDDDDEAARSMEVLGEDLGTLEAVEAECVRLLRWRVPIDWEVYAEAASRLLPRLDFFLRLLEQPTPRKPPRRKRLTRPFSPTSILVPMSPIAELQ